MTQVVCTHWPLAPGLAPPPFAGAGAVLRQVQLAAGKIAERHSHDHEQFLLVVAGRGMLTCEAGDMALTPGTLIRLPAGAWHSANFTEPTVLIEVSIVQADA